MTALAPTLEAFFTCRLVNEKGVSPHTIAAYRDTFRLLLTFAHERTGKQPSALELEDLDATLIAAFLDHLEHQRGNSPRIRNARLAAIHSMFRYAALRHPEHAPLISRVIAVPTKRFDRAIVTYLTPDEVDALLAAPDRERWIGRRDHALLTVIDVDGQLVFDRAVRNEQAAIERLLDDAGDQAALVIDQPGSIGALAVAVARRRGIPVAYVPRL